MNFCKLTTDVDQYNEDNIYFLEPIKNNVMNNGFFIRIIYSNSLFTLNGIYLSLQFNCTSIDKYYSKFKCSFDVIQHRELVEKICMIEKGILQKCNVSGKSPQFKIYEQLKCGHIKIFADEFEKIGNLFLLKIAGIWETDTEYGVTYKFSQLAS